jgi:hypothetical protein
MAGPQAGLGRGFGCASPPRPRGGATTRLPGHMPGRIGLRMVRRRRLDPDTGRYRRLSRYQKEVNTAHARIRGPGEPARRVRRPAVLSGRPRRERLRTGTRYSNVSRQAETSTRPWHAV